MLRDEVPEGPVARLTQTGEVSGDDVLFAAAFALTLTGVAGLGETRRPPWPPVAPRLLAAGAGLMAAARRRTA